MDRAFKTALNDFLEREAEAQRRAEMTEQFAEDLILKGAEFYPWTFDHFEEAMGNATNGERALAFATIASAVDFNLDNPHANHMALVSVKQMVERYWLESARSYAEKNL